MMLSDAYIGPKSRTERPRKTKIGTEVAHVTRDSDTTFKVTGRFVNRRVGSSGGCSDRRGNVLSVGNCCYVAVCSASPTGEERGGAYRGSRARLHLVYVRFLADPGFWFGLFLLGLGSFEYLGEIVQPLLGKCTGLISL